MPEKMIPSPYPFASLTGRFLLTMCRFPKFIPNGARSFLSSTARKAKIRAYFQANNTTSSAHYTDDVLMSGLQIFARLYCLPKYLVAHRSLSLERLPMRECLASFQQDLSATRNTAGRPSTLQPYQRHHDQDQRSQGVEAYRGSNRRPDKAASTAWLDSYSFPRRTRSRQMWMSMPREVPLTDGFSQKFGGHPRGTLIRSGACSR
jgi:hypothetical protein